MIKYLQTLVLVALSINTLLAISPKEIIKKGTRLVYDVNYGGSNYEFTVTVKDNTKDYVFDWRMNGPTKSLGSLNLNKEAIDNATGIFNYFTASGVNPVDQCCVVLSKKMYDSFKDNGSMEIYTDKKNGIRTIFGNPIDHTQSFAYNNLSNEFDCRTVNDGGDYQITYVNNPEFPLIVEMKLDWSLKLKAIYNN